VFGCLRRNDGYSPFYTFLHGFSSTIGDYKEVLSRFIFGKQGDLERIMVNSRPNPKVIP